MADADDGLRVIDRWDGGFGWLARPGEPLRRASHALTADGGTWVVDPVDAPGLDDRLADLGPVAGVVVCLDRHKRDAGALAARHDVAVHLPRALAGIADAFDADTTVFDGDLADTGYRTRPVVDNRLWREVALHDPERGTLLVPEALGTAPHYCAPGERLGVHPALRLAPPRRALGGLEPERLLVGHGNGVLDDAAGAITEALRGARWRAPGLYAATLRRFLAERLR